MSASEKLKALSDSMNPVVSLVAYPRQINALRSALPEMVAMAQAAEAVDTLMEDDGAPLDAETFAYRMLALNSALVALEEKLT